MASSDREWGCRVEGEIMLTISGPDAEVLARSAAQLNNGLAVYREPERPTEQNGWQLHGPWIEAA